MSTTDADRHRLHTTLGRVLGDDAAGTLMSHLPPVGWADVATKQDLEHLREHMDARFATVDVRFEAMHTTFDARFEAIDVRFEAIDTRFGATDTRFEALEAKFDASLQRAMKEQTNRCLLIVAAVTTILGTVQQLLG
jgi:hypothetical protein